MITGLHIASTFGLLLGLSLLAGLLAERIRLPKVTAYLLAGLIAGPSVLDWIPQGQVDGFEPMLQLAMALVLFGLGCQFPLQRIRRIVPRAMLLSLGELGATFVLVTGGLLLLGQPVGISVLLGTLALATAPATTVLVFKEFRSEGPVTEFGSMLVALNNFASIIAFEVAFLTIHLFDGSLAGHLHIELGILFRDVLGSICAGLVTGVLLSYICGLLSSGHWLVMLVAVTTFLLGICESFDIPYLLTFLVMGVTVANTSNVSTKIVSELDHLTGLLCVLFFAVHGAELNVAAFLALGVAGVGYIVCRTCGKYLGIWAVATATRQPVEVRHWLGSALFSQAGAAIALSTIAVNRDPERGAAVQTIILGSVVFFEIMGPLFIRQSVLRAGEVPISEAIHHTSQTAASQILELWDRFIVSIGRGRPNAEPPGELRVADLLRKNVTGIDQSADFDQVISYIAHSHDNTYPVVDAEQKVVGLIRYPLLSNVMFDNTVSRLVRAEDLATPPDFVLHPDEPALRACELFQISPDDCLPVVTREAPQTLLGVVRRRDVMHMLIQQSRAQQNGGE